MDPNMKNYINIGSMGDYEYQQFSAQLSLL